MNQIAAELTASLTHGSRKAEIRLPEGPDPVKILAKAYEVARNALEFRADHLVRRAAIERILRRQMTFSKNAHTAAETLLQELEWARYIWDSKDEKAAADEITEIIKKYLGLLESGEINKDWLYGVISAEIEAKLNPNQDFYKFTTFAYHMIKRKIRLEKIENLDLAVFTAVDRVYSQSDDQQVSYHLLQLIESQAEKTDGFVSGKHVALAYKYFLDSGQGKLANRLNVFVRKQMGPLVLLRDMYFSDPEKFKAGLDDENQFMQSADLVLAEQLWKIKGRLRTATIRSLIYVFLTKMLLILVIEVPIERLIGGSGSLFTLGANMAFPVAIMWILTSQIKLPSIAEQEAVKQEAAEMIFRDHNEVPDTEVMTSLDHKGTTTMIVLYYMFYGLLFVGIFSLIISVLGILKYTIISKLIFILFLCLVTFFAFRIKQTTMVYAFRPKVRGKSSFLDNLMLPIVTVGGWLSQGVSRLNFLVFVFDFVLEAPFKLILHFLDKWFSFLAAKKEEVVG